MRHIQWAEHHCIQDAEDHSIGSDAEGQRDERGEKEPRSFGKLANGELQVTEHDA